MTVGLSEARRTMPLCCAHARETGAEHTMGFPTLGRFPHLAARVAREHGLLAHCARRLRGAETGASVSAC